MKKTIYLDTCVLVDYFGLGPKIDKSSKALIVRAISALKESDVDIVTSSWTLTEMVKVLINEKRMDPREVAEIVKNIEDNGKINELRISIIPVSQMNNNYSFDDFFLGIREKMLLYNPGWGDAIHGVIMTNNGVKNILTINCKDFDRMSNITVMHPNDIIDTVNAFITKENNKRFKIRAREFGN